MEDNPYIEDESYIELVEALISWDEERQFDYAAAFIDEIAKSAIGGELESFKSLLMLADQATTLLHGALIPGRHSQQEFEEYQEKFLNYLRNEVPDIEERRDKDFREYATLHSRRKGFEICFTVQLHSRKNLLDLLLGLPLLMINVL